MRTPFPFEPRWVAQFGALGQEGRGLLAGNIPRHLVGSFTVKLPGTWVTVEPFMGKVSVNGSTVALKGPSKLVWFRRMTAQIGTHDKNETCSPQCDFYGIGVENESGRFGFHITPDEQLREGIPA